MMQEIKKSLRMEMEDREGGETTTRRGYVLLSLLRGPKVDQ